ncbi:MAG: DUF4402 domain-containing protein [bacterium]
MKKIIMILSLIFLFVLPSLALAQSNTLVNVSTEVVSSFALSKVSDVAFGEMTANMTRAIGEGDMGAGKVLCAGVRDAPVAFWASSSTGSTGGDVTSTITLSNGTATLTLSSVTIYDINSNLSATGKPLNTHLDSFGNGGVEVGGTLNVPDGTTAGTYTGSAYVFAEYD